MMNKHLSASDISRKQPMLLLEPDALLRRTVTLTARSLGLGEIAEAMNPDTARRLIRQRQFSGAVIALDFGDRSLPQYDLTLIDELRERETDGHPPVPIAVMVAYCDSALLVELRLRNVSRIIIKPFRARVLIDTFSAFHAAPVP